MSIRPILALTALIILQSCLQPKHADLHVPDQVARPESATAIQIPGMNLYIDKPAGFHLVAGKPSIKKDERTFINVTAVSDASFAEIHTQMKEKLAKYVQSGEMPKPYYQKDFLFGADSAFLTYAPDVETKGDALMLAFGDSADVAVVVGYVPKGDVAAAGDMLRVMESAYIKKSIDFDSLSLQKYSLDVSGSPFQYRYTDGTRVTYVTSLAGQSDQDTIRTKIIVSVLPGAEDKDMLHDFFDKMSDQLKGRGIPVPAFHVRDLTLNNTMACETVFNTRVRGEEMTVYMLVAGKAGVSVFLFGLSRKDQPWMASQIMQVAQTLRLK